MYVYINDISSHIYHMVNCQHLSKTSIDRISSFENIGECEAHGYKICKHCAPLKKYYDTEKDEIERICLSNGIWFHNQIAFFYIDTVKSQWKIIFNESSNRLQLYHQNLWSNRDSSVIPEYHLQDASSRTVCGFLKYIISHDQYRQKNPVYIPETKSANLKRGSKSWKKRIKKRKKRNKARAARRVVRMIESMQSEKNKNRSSRK